MKETKDKVGNERMPVGVKAGLEDEPAGQYKKDRLCKTRVRRKENLHDPVADEMCSVLVRGVEPAKPRSINLRHHPSSTIRV